MNDPYRMTPKTSLTECSLVRERRTANINEETSFLRLVDGARTLIKTWEDPEVRPFARLITSSEKAATRLSHLLKKAGYAVDYHWQGGANMGNGAKTFAVQFALYKDLLGYRERWGPGGRDAAS